MTEALRQAAQAALTDLDDVLTFMSMDASSRARIEANTEDLRAALAQPPAPTAQPAAYWIPKAEQFCIAKSGERPFAKAWEPLYAQPVQQPGADCAQYLKDGETPAQRIERERRDTDATLTLLIREKERTKLLEELLRSAHCIALRQGADTAWDTFAASVRAAGIGSVTARVYKAQPVQQQPGAEPLQGGMDNAELLAAWKKKLPGVEPSDAQLTAFAVGVEVGFAHARDLERQDWSRVHHALAKHGVHPGRTDDHLADVIDMALAAPAQRQPLSDEEIDHLWDTRVGDPTPAKPLTGNDVYKFARAIEAAHGITAAAELRRQHAEIERLRADAARYRWLRDTECSIDVFGNACALTMDSAIDAAMRDAPNVGAKLETTAPAQN